MQRQIKGDLNKYEAVKWQPTPVFLPGESQGLRSLVGCRLWGRTESDTTSDLAAAAELEQTFYQVKVEVSYTELSNSIIIQII